MEKIHHEDTESHKESFPCSSNDKGSLESKDHVKNQAIVIDNIYKKKIKMPITNEK
jgi:hypothetical protein